MTAPLQGDAAFKYTTDGQVYWHYLGHPLHNVTPSRPEQVFQHVSADFSTTRRVRIASSVVDARAVIRWDGQPDSLSRFTKEAMAGAALEYFPSIADPSLSFPCEMVSADAIGANAGLNNRYGTQIQIRRTDGGSFEALMQTPMVYYRAGNAAPLTLTRSGAIGPYTDEDGVIQAVAANIPRVSVVGGVPYLVLGDARVNLVDEDDISNWSDINTPVVTSSVSDPAGGTGAYTVEDNDGATAEYKHRTVTFTGDAQKVVSCVVRENTAPGTGNQRIQLYDTVAFTARLALDISAWSAGEPTVAASTGTYLGKRYVGNGYWELFGLTTTVTAANSNRLEIRPAVTASATGSIDVFRLNAVNDTVADLGVLNESETRAAETAYLEFSRTPQAMTVYVKFLALAPSGEGSGRRVFHIGSATGADAPRLAVYDGTSRFRARHNNGDTAVTSADDNLTAVAAFDAVELVVTLAADGSVQLIQSIDGAAEETSTASGASSLKEDWADTRMYLNSAGSGNRGAAAFSDVKVTDGARSMAYMRAL